MARSAWLRHVMAVRAKNKGMAFKNVLKMAKRSYKKVGGGVAANAAPIPSVGGAEEAAPEEEAAPVISDVEKSPASIVSDFEKSQLKEDMPSFRPGDSVSVSVKVKDGQRTRLQAFEGVVMSVRNSGLNSSFIV